MTYGNSSNSKPLAVRIGEDKRKESLVSEYIDRYVYPAIGVSVEEAVTDKERQVKGIDKIISLDGQTYKCDEKAAVGGKYWNPYHMDNRGVNDYYPLDTFCLECLCRPKGYSPYNPRRNHMDGWFLSDSNETDVYLMNWIMEARPSAGNQDMFDSVDDITESISCLVKVDALKSYLSLYGFDKTRIREIATSLLSDSNKYNKPRYTVGTGRGYTIKFNRITSLTEDPINIQLYKELYNKLALKSVHLRRNKDGQMEIVHDVYSKLGRRVTT